MRRGGWVPISKGLRKALPRDRAYTELEAAYSLQMDFDSDEEVTLSGYSTLWRWSKDKVRRFLSKMMVEIVYPSDTALRQNQRGKLKSTDNRPKADRKPTDNRLIRLINSRDLRDVPDRRPTDDRQKADRRSDTTIEPEPLNKKPLCGFDEFWSSYPKKVGKAPACKAWAKLKPDDDLRQTILAALASHRKSVQWQKDDGQYIPNAATWLNQRRWEDELSTDTNEHAPESDPEAGRQAEAMAKEILGHG